MRVQLALGVGMALVVLSSGYPDPGTPKMGRIVIDDSHSFEWEQAARRLDEQFYGDFSTYSYATMSEHLSRCYDVVAVTSKESLRQALRECDVLMIKTPEVDFDAGECKAIQEFVRKGGGLLAIGDHTNLFGMNTRLNQVLGPMGALLRDDSVRSASDSYFVRAETPVMGRHPALAHVESITFMSGCSVWTARSSQVVLSARNAVADPADYVTSSFFPSWSNDGAAPCGRVGVMAALSWGQGRVIVFSDGTPFSSFDYYKGNYPEAMLCMIEWLNRGNGPGWVRLILGILGWGALALAAWIGGREAWRGVRSLVAVTTGAYAGMGLIGLAGACYYPEVVEHAGPPAVGFLEADSFASFPASLGSPGPIAAEAVFDTLYNVPLRLGRRCRRYGSLGDLVVGNPGTAVLVNLVKCPTGEEIRQLVQWIEAGGTLVCLQRAVLYRSEGMSAIAQACAIELELNADRTPWMPGTTRIASPQGVIAGEKRMGKGRVMCVVSDDVFCNKSLGHSMSIPTERQRSLYDFLLAIFAYDGPREDLCIVRR